MTMEARGAGVDPVQDVSDQDTSFDSSPWQEEEEVAEAEAEGEGELFQALQEEPKR